MEMSFMSGFGAILHLSNLKHKRQQPSKLLDRVISVEFALKDDCERDDRLAVPEEVVMAGIVHMGDHRVLLTTGDQVLIMVEIAVQFMIGTTVQCMTGEGVLIMGGNRSPVPVDDRRRSPAIAI